MAKKKTEVKPVNKVLSPDAERKKKFWDNLETVAQKFEEYRTKLEYKRLIKLETALERLIKSY